MYKLQRSSPLNKKWYIQTLPKEEEECEVTSGRTFLDLSSSNIENMITPPSSHGNTKQFVDKDEIQDTSSSCKRIS